MILTIFTLPLFGWSNHAGITYLILENYWEKEPSVPVESLESFLEKEKTHLTELLPKIEEKVQKQIPHYPTSNGSLVFNPDSKAKKAELLTLFFRSLRLNPNHKASLYIQSKSSKAKGNAIPLEEITFLKDKGKLPNERFLKINEGSQAKASEVLATATDEPDYGMDLHLFSDSESSFGKEYGFGEQPFGNPKYEYSSQAPFHMGFFHESGLVYTLAPFLAKTYPEARVIQFSELSKFAFEKGHSYWGYRFAGWALHYIGDMTQPYHASVLPRIGTGKRIAVQLASMVGWGKPKENMINHISDRHTFVEEYQYFLFRELREGKFPVHPILTELQKPVQARQLPWEDSTFHKQISLVSYNLSEETDEQLEETGITQFSRLYEENHPLHSILGKCLANTTLYTHSYLRYIEGSVKK